MIVKFDGVLVNIEDPNIQRRIKNYITGKSKIKTGRTWKHWTEQEDEQVKDLFQSGKSFEEIGKEVNRTPKAVEVRLYSKGILQNNPIAVEGVKQTINL